MKKILFPLVIASMIGASFVSADEVPVVQEEKAKGFLTEKNLDEARKLCAFLVVLAPGYEFFAGNLTSRKEEVMMKWFSEHFDDCYRILSSALEKSDFLIKVRNILFVPFNDAYNNNGIFSFFKESKEQDKKNFPQDEKAKKDISTERLPKFIESFLIAFAKEVAHTTSGKLVKSYLDGKENRIYRRATNVITNSVLTGIIIGLIKYLGGTVASVNPLGWKPIEALKPALGQGWTEVKKSVADSIVYEILGEMLIRIAEGEDSLDFAEVFGIDKIALDKEDVNALFGKE
ncbi:MAG: hypothetical protein V1855_02550 [bacterium]